MADIRRLTDKLSVAPQLTTADIAEADKQNFKTVLCNRPDEEEANQPAYREIKQAIESAGLVSEFQPVNGSAISDQDIDDFSAHLDSLPGPVLAYCRTGTRCTVLWALSEAGKRSTDDILAIAGSAGYALEPLRPRIDDRAARRQNSSP